MDIDAFLEEMQARARLAGFSVGEYVSFHRRHFEVIGPVVRVNRRTLTIRDEELGRCWRVAPAKATRLPWMKGPMLP